MEYLDQRENNEPVVKHYLSKNGAKVQIAEPTGFDAAKFIIRQDDKRYGRDVSFAPSDLTFNSLTDVRGLTHNFGALIADYRANGFESDWKYILAIEGVEYIIGELDFKTAKTDELTYFTTNIIQENDQEILKKREDIEVNLFSDKDLDGNPITPLATQKIFLRATPEKQDSKWDLYEPYYLYRGNPGGGGSFYVDFNPFPVIKKSQIEDTLSPVIQSFGEMDDLAIIEAANTLTNVTLSVKGLNFKMEIDNFVNKFGYATCSFIYKIGENADPGGWVEIFNTGYLKKEGNHSYQLTDQDFTIPNLTIPRDQKLFLWFSFYLDTQNQPFTAQLWVDQGSVEVTSTSTSISSTIETFNLGDAMKQVVKSISGLETDAPRFIGGEFKEQYITNGLLMRNITDQAFTLSLKKILDYLPELNGDYEVNNGKVFFGLYEDFYQNIKIGSFTMPPSEKFESAFNERYTVNEFNFKYGKYEKGNDEDKSREAVHTEMQMLLPNKRVENKKDVNVGFIRDTFLIESTRKEAIKVNDDVATPQDEDIFIIDVVEKEVFVSETFTLYHKMDGNTLKLLNDGSFNFSFLGLTEFQQIIIICDNENSGPWIVGEIEDDVLTLSPISASIGGFNGYAITQFNYYVTDTNLTNRTSEGFEIIENTTTPDGFSNLRFTPKRNTWYYWGRYLSACCAYHLQTNDFIKVTEFIHNGALVTKYQDDGLLTFTEDADIRTSILSLPMYEKALLTPKLVTTPVLAEFSEFWALREKIRKERGYIEVMDTNGNTVNIYPQELEYIWKDNLLNITGEVKA